MGEFIAFLFCLAIMYGYVMNIVKLSQSKRFSGMDALRVVGIFLPPMGVVFGFVK